MSGRARPAPIRGRHATAKGGDEPTVTDAQVVLGRLDADKLLGGDLVIDPDLSTRAIEDKLAKPMGLTVTDAALGIIRVVNSNMALAIPLSIPWPGASTRGTFP